MFFLLLLLDYAWQNGTTNLIKAISFDLLSSSNITQKAYRWYGEFNQLKDTANEDQLRIDLLLTRPQQKNVFSAYDKALKILENTETNKKLIEEEELDNYVSDALESVNPLES